MQAGDDLLHLPWLFKLKGKPDSSIEKVFAKDHIEAHKLWCEGKGEKLTRKELEEWKGITKEFNL
jgi:hypothetical protein